MIIIKLFKRICILIECTFSQLQHFGFKIAFWSLLFPFYHLLRFLKYYLGSKKHQVILLYLSKRYTGVIEKFANKTQPPEYTINHEATIWVCWWDGEEAMPDIVKVCYNSIKQHSGTHQVKLVTKSNFRNFVSIPPYIYEKVDSGIITITHFSDILRAALLYEHGGIWLDATVLVLHDFQFDNLPFYSLKTTTRTNSITNSQYQGLSDEFKYAQTQNSPEINRWSGFLLAGAKESVLFGFMRDILYAYWKDQTSLIDYLLVDYTISLAYDTIPGIKKMIDVVPCIDMDKFALEKSLNTEYSEKESSQYLSVPFHKLTWKENFATYTKNHKLTIYGHLINTYLNA